MSQSPASALPSRRAVPQALRSTILVLLGTGLLAASSWVSIPLRPVPVTMQTFAVLLIGALLGPRLAVATVLTFLAEAALGLPVLAGGASGLAYMTGPTGGYLAGFPLAAALVGYAVERRWVQGLFGLCAVMILAHALIILTGVSWLAVGLGLDKAVAVGATPFLLGTLLKSALAAASVRVLIAGRAAPIEGAANRGEGGA